MKRPHVLILGAGPAGVGTAFQLAKRNLAEVTVLERKDGVGGNAGSFELAGVRVDYGSHRLHPACDPKILETIKGLVGEDLLDRPRHGRIRLHGRWVHFPLKPIDLLLKVSPTFALGVAKDLIKKVFPPRSTRPEQETFATILDKGLGRTICQEFYFPYAEKLWGLPAEQLALTQAKRRVGANSLGKMIRKVLTAVPGLRPAGAGRFYYPRQGFGQITESLFHAAEQKGARFQFGASVKALKWENERITGVTFERDGTTQEVTADYVWSTLPVTGIIRALTPPPPDEILTAVNQMEYRAMILVYLVLEKDQFSEYDAHYFPERDVRISRLSEPKNYSGSGPQGRTVLCAELPCAPTDPEWQMSDTHLGDLVCQALERSSIPVTAPIKEVRIHRLRFAYPVYRQGYEEHFQKLDAYGGRFSNLLTFGRQGLFAHDNTHHALYMAHAAVDCLGETGSFDQNRWDGYRKIFESHVVED